MVTVDLDAPVTQLQFADLVGVSQQAVSQLAAAGVFVEGAPAREWLLHYVARLREQAAGRSQALAAERAALARSQRERQEIKNAAARRDFAPVSLLGEVLGMASASVSDRMDALRGDLRRRCPDLSEAALSVIDDMLAGARAEWVRATARLVAADLAALPDDEGDELDALFDDEGGGSLPDHPEEGDNP